MVIRGGGKQGAVDPTSQKVVITCKSGLRDEPRKRRAFLIRTHCQTILLRHLPLPHFRVEVKVIKSSGGELFSFKLEEGFYPAGLEFECGQ
ncbi:hypothetical protein NPIL_672111 [Nephila pilipes]|uniref:Uncharacterized protein n=1 Tax=Nephila pilipes TaxID=299642 RepID=A0A8X6NUI8_NEPPI|nr:hypothetical protein NPIL_672111 [Nephila pilipes]